MDIARILSNKTIVLVGAGQLGQMALDLWPPSLQKPGLVLDARREGTLVGIPIENTVRHVPSASNMYVLSFFKESARNVLALYREKFHQEVITVYDVLTHYDADRFSNGWIGTKTLLPLAMENLSYFHDDYSKKVYKAAVEWRYNRYIVEDYPVSDEKNKYDIAKYVNNGSMFDFVIDGGSFDLSFGATLRKTGTTWKRLVAFEPDPSRYSILRNIISTLDKPDGLDFRVALDQRALWSSSDGCMFYPNGLLSARIARRPDASCIPIKTITLSDVLDEYNVPPQGKVLVKLHVEGAEWPVIETSRSLLEDRAEISLLINLSHDQDSLIRIPRMLGETGKYRLYLESHSLFGEGLTLFAKSQVK